MASTHTNTADRQQNGTGELFLYSLHLADNVLVLAQRNAEWTGHGPVLEQDIAITNISLDLLGQARNFYQYAADLYNGFDDQQRAHVDAYIPRLWKSYNRALQEDDLALLRDEHQYLNLLIAELPKGDWAFSIMRQFLFSAWQFYSCQHLQQSSDSRLAAIAEKSIKEVAYHLRWSGEWVIRLGDGTGESKGRMEKALADLWMYSGEFFMPATFETNAAEAGITVDADTFKDDWLKKVADVFSEATIELPAETTWYQSGGKKGHHTEHMGYLLAEMQYLQRAYPNSVW